MSKYRGNAAIERERERERIQMQERDSGFLGNMPGKTGVNAARTQTPPPPPPKGELILKTNHLTPNGLKILIYAQELLNADPEVFDLGIQRVNLVAREHQSPEFLELNPCGRIPVLIDKSRDDFPVFESAAILLYLEQNFDKKKLFTYDPVVHPKEYSSMIQWVLWAHGGLGPMQTQAHYFRHYCNADVPFAKQRFIEETEKSYTVMNKVLTNRDWLVDGPKGFTIADINVYPWIRLHNRAGVPSLEHRWPKLQAWLDRMNLREGIHRAIRQAAEIGEDRTPITNLAA